MLGMFEAIGYCLLMCLRFLEISVLKYMKFIAPVYFQLLSDQHDKQLSKRLVDLLTYIDMLLLVEKAIR